MRREGGKGVLRMSGKRAVLASDSTALKPPRQILGRVGGTAGVDDASNQRKRSDRQRLTYDR